MEGQRAAVLRGGEVRSEEGISFCKGPIAKGGNPRGFFNKGVKRGGMTKPEE